MATYAVIGLGQLGASVAIQLAERGADVIAIDSDLGRVEQIKDRVARALSLDATDEKALRAAGVADCDTVVLALGEAQLEESVLTTMALRELGVGRIISRAATDMQARVLERLGVTRVVFPERQMGIQLARQILTPSLHDIVPLGDLQALAEVTTPPELVGKTLAEAELRRVYGVNVVAIHRRREGVDDAGQPEVHEEVDSVPGPDTRLAAGDRLVVVGPDARIRAFAEE